MIHDELHKDLKGNECLPWCCSGVEDGIVAKKGLKGIVKPTKIESTWHQEILASIDPLPGYWGKYTSLVVEWWHPPLS